jgi:hypothetical protein
MVVIRASQKLFSETEVATLTGMCLETLRQMAQSKHLGFIQRAAEAAGQTAEQLFFTHADVMVLNLLTHSERSGSQD